MKSLLKILFPIFLSLLLVVFGLELPTRWWIRYHGNPLQRAKLIQEWSSDWGWRQRPNLNSTFESQPVLTDDFGFRLSETVTENFKTPLQALVLGPSSTFGWGVKNDETYSGILNLRAASTNLRVFNGGQIGFSLFQGSQVFSFLSDIQKLRSPFVILAYGVNDLDHFRFFGGHPGVPDSRIDAVNDGSLMEKTFSHSALAALLWDGWSEARFFFKCGFQSEPAIRNPWLSFQNQLQNIFKKTTELNSRLVLLDTPARQDFPPDLDAARQSDGLYLSSFHANQDGNCGQAKKDLIRARQLEPFRVQRDIQTFNKSLCEWAGQQGVYLVKASTELRQKDDFVDPIHPSVQGHRKIAELLSKIVFQNSK